MRVDHTIMINEAGVRLVALKKVTGVAAIVVIVLAGCATVFASLRARQQTPQAAKDQTLSLPFSNVFGAPLNITSFSVNYRKRSPDDNVSGHNDRTTASDGYVMDGSWVVVYTDTRAVRSALFKFTHTGTGHAFYAQRTMTPGKEQSGTGAQTFSIQALSLDADPEDLTLQLVRVHFTDDDTWGTYPDSGADQAGAGNDRLATSSVDARPVPLNYPAPHYTDNARLNQIIGTVVVRVSFKIDGTIKVVDVVNPLPGGLTKAAIRAVEQMKFKPALKDGRAVEFEGKFTVSFQLA